MFKLQDDCNHTAICDLLISYVTLQVKTPAQLEAAFSFFSAAGSEIKLNEFESACGVGMIIFNVIWFGPLVGLHTIIGFSS